MGTLDSIGMFAYHEHNVFLFYFLKRFNYKFVADIGANIGLHSILLSKFGYKVDAYEPDPDHHRHFCALWTFLNVFDILDVVRRFITTKREKY